jgi:hypothetical protein
VALFAEAEAASVAVPVPLVVVSDIQDSLVDADHPHPSAVTIRTSTDPPEDGTRGEEGSIA